MKQLQKIQIFANVFMLFGRLNKSKSSRVHYLYTTYTTAILEGSFFLIIGMLVFTLVIIHIIILGSSVFAMPETKDSPMELSLYLLVLDVHYYSISRIGHRRKACDHCLWRTMTSTLQQYLYLVSN